MVFATDKEIGLQILPFDGNPYKTLGMIGHPHKVYKKNIVTKNDHNDTSTNEVILSIMNLQTLLHSIYLYLFYYKIRLYLKITIHRSLILIDHTYMR